MTEGTTYCVYCLKRPAVVWGGHVLRENARRGKPRRVTAGWCRRHAKIPLGFVGHYVLAMGYRVGTFPMWLKKRV